MGELDQQYCEFQHVAITEAGWIEPAVYCHEHLLGMADGPRGEVVTS